MCYTIRDYKLSLLILPDGIIQTLDNTMLDNGNR